MAVEFAAAALDRAAVSPGRKPGYVDAPRVTVVAGADRNLRSEHLLPRRIVEPDGKIALGVRNAYVEYITAWVGEKLHRNARTVDDRSCRLFLEAPVLFYCRGTRGSRRSLYRRLHDTWPVSPPSVVWLLRRHIYHCKYTRRNHGKSENL